VSEIQSIAKESEIKLQVIRPDF